MDEFRLKGSIDIDGREIIKEVLNDMKEAEKQAKKGIKVKTSIDKTGIKDLKKFEDQYTKFQGLNKQNKVSKYFANEQNALKGLTDAWNTFKNAQNKGKINENDLTSESKATAVLRMANAYQALGYDLSKVSPEIVEFQKKMSGLMSAKSPDYDYTVERFKGTFDQVKSLLDEMSSNGFDVSKIISGLKEVEEQSTKTASAIKETQEGSAAKSAGSSQKSSIPERMKELKYYSASLEECRKAMQKIDNAIFEGENVSPKKLKDYVGYYQRLSQLKDTKGFSSTDQELLDNYKYERKNNDIFSKKAFEQAEQELAEYKEKYIQNLKEIEAAEENLANSQNKRTQSKNQSAASKGTEKKTSTTDESANAQQTAEAVAKATEEFKEEAQAAAQSAAAVEAAESDKQAATEKTREKVALTIDEMERALKASHTKSSVSDSNIFGDLNIDESLSDIEKWSQAVRELIELKDEALKISTYYQNDYANGKTTSSGASDDYKRWSDSYGQDYLKYSDYLEHAQLRLQESLKTFKPSADGANADSINALVLLLQRLVEQSEQVSRAFGTIDDNANLKPLLSLIEDINTALSKTQNLFNESGQLKFTSSEKVPFEVEVSVGNKDELRLELKETLEWEGGFPVKIKPIIDPDISLEIDNVVLKNVKAEGTIDTSNAKINPTSPAASTSNDVVQANEKLQTELEETKQKTKEVGQSSQQAAEVQKRSLLEVIQEYEKIESAQKALMQQNDIAATSYDSGMSAFIEKKKEDAKQYTEVNDLIAKIQSKQAEPTKDSARLSDVAKHYAGIIEYVNRLKELQGNKFSYDVLGENGEQKFLKMQSIVDQCSVSTDVLTQRIIELGNKLTSLNTEKSGLEKTASDAEQLEVTLYGLVKKLESLKNANKSKALGSFIEEWDKYKLAGGTLDISAFTSEEKVINSVNKAYEKLIQQRKESSARLKASFEILNTDININQFDSIFKQVETGVLTVEQATTRINASIKELRSTMAQQGTATKPDTSAQEQHEREKKVIEEVIEAEKKLDDVQRESGKPVDSATAPKSNGLEVTNMENLRKKVSEVTTAVGHKTDAFSNEAGVVGDVVQYEISNMEILRKKVSDVTTAVNNKTDAFSMEAGIVGETVQYEIANLQILENKLISLREALLKIASTPISIDLKLSDGASDPQNNINKIISDLKESLNSIDPSLLQNLSSAMQTLKVKESAAKNVQKLANAILNLKSNLNNVSASGNEFLQTIKELTTSAGAAQALKSLADVLNTTSEKLERAKQAAKELSETNTNNQDPTKTTIDISKGTDEWERIKNAALEYKDVLGDIQKITYSMRQDKDGKQLKSYKITGSKSSITLGENLNVVAQKDTETYTKSANEQLKIYNDFIEAARKANLSFDLGSLKVDQNGVITFTSTIEEAGEKAVITKYRIDDLYGTLEKGVRNNGQVALNKDGSLNKSFLNQHATGTVTTDLSAEYSNADKDALIEAHKQSVEYQKQENEYIQERKRLLAEGKAQEEEYYNQQYRNTLASAYADADENVKRENEYIQERKRLLAEGKKQEQEYYKQQQQLAKETEKQTAEQQKKWQSFEQEQNSYVSNKFENEAVNRNQQAYEELTDTIQRYSEVSQRIASGKARDGDVEEAERLEAKISELQKQPILSPSQVEQSERALVKLYNRLDDLEKKTKETKQASDESVKTKAIQDTADKMKELQMQGSGDAFANTFAKANEDINKLNAELKEGTITLSEYKTKVSAIQDELSGNKASQAIKELNQDIGKLSSSLKESFNSNMGLEKFENTLKNVISNYETLNSLKMKGLVDEGEFSAVSKYFNAFISDISNKPFGNIDLSKQSDEFIAKYKQAEIQLGLVADALRKVQAGDAFTSEDTANLQKYIDQMRELNKLNSDNASKPVNPIKTQNLLGDIAKTMSKNTAMSKELRQEFEALEAQIRSFGNNLPKGQYEAFLAQFKELETIMIKTGQTGRSFFDGIIKKARGMSQSFIAMYFSFYDWIRYIRQGFTVLKELDTALTEMRKVSDESLSSLKNYQKVSFDAASAVGTTGKQIQNSTADWMGIYLVPLYGNI